MFARIEVVGRAVVGVSAVEVVVVRGSDGDLVADVVSAVDQGVHVSGQVSAFTAGAGDDDHGCVGELFRAAHEAVGIDADRLRQMPALRGDSRSACSLAASGSRIVGVDLRQLVVDRIAGILEALENADVAGRVRRSGTCAAVDRVGGRPAEHVQVLDGVREREHAFIFQKNEAFLADFLDDVLTLGGRLFLKLRGVVQEHREVVLERAEADQVDDQGRSEDQRDAGAPADHMAVAFFRHKMGGDHHDDDDHEHSEKGVDVAAAQCYIVQQVCITHAHGP